MNIFAHSFRAVGTSFLEMLAPRHCELCGISLPSHLEYGTQAIPPTKQRRFEFVCNRCVDALPPAPTPDALLNSRQQMFPGDALALNKIAAMYSLNSSSLSQQLLEEKNKSMSKSAPDVHQLIYALKYHGRSRIGVEFGRELGELLGVLGMTTYHACVPVPLHAARVRERGFNQAVLIAEGITSVLHIPVETAWVHRSHYTQSQTSMNAEQRKQNMVNVFVASKSVSRLRGARILLVDDVLTTGSTLNACATALLEGGARSVDAATLVAA